MRRKLLAVCLSVLILSPGVLRAQVSVGGQASWADDFDLGLGARGMVGLPIEAAPLELIGSFDYFFPGDGITYWEINGNLAYLIPIPKSNVTPYVGGGINIAHAEVDVPFVGQVSDTEAALNLLGGARVQAGQVMPFGELRVEVGSESQFVLTGGVTIQVGPGFATSK